MAPAELELKRTWTEALPRYLTALDALFVRALEKGCEAEFVLSLLGVRGVSDGGWDPWITTDAMLETMEPLINEVKDQPTRRHLRLWTWGYGGIPMAAVTRLQPSTLKGLVTQGLSFAGGLAPPSPGPASGPTAEHPVRSLTRPRCPRRVSVVGAIRPIAPG